MAFWIYQNGETEDRTLSRLEKKFERKTLETKAMLFVLDAIKAKLKPISE
ncbi:MAG: hypothetical protein MZU84_07235 [Sphingobacterium sp.]|nr:hypothetical protein [Sphingobacterium sp.]